MGRRRYDPPSDASVVLPKREITVALTEAEFAHLEDLHKSGFWGFTLKDTAERVVGERLRQLDLEGHPRRNRG